MGETGGTAGDQERATADGPGRRALLKGAVAAGVGAAAWTAPDIKTLGFTPAYAQTCSPGQVEFFVGPCASTNVGNCSSMGTQYARIQPFQPSDFPSLPGGATVELFCGGSSAPNPGCCSLDGDPNLVFADVPAGTTCQVSSIEVWQGSGSCSGPSDTVVVGSLDIPSIEKIGGGNISYRVTIECGPDACFP